MNPPMTLSQLDNLIANPGGGLKVTPNLQFWDYSSRALQDAAREAPPRSRLADNYNFYARAIKDQIDDMVPEMRTAREGAGGLIQGRNALQMGHDFATRPSNAARNDEMRLALAKMNQEQRMLAQGGFVGGLRDKLEGTPLRHDLTAKVGQSPAAQEQLAIGLGKEGADEFMAQRHIENLFQAAHTAVTGNSTTARQLIEAGFGSKYGMIGSGLVGGYLEGNESPLDMLKDPTGFMTGMLVAGAARGHLALNQRVARQMATLLTSNDPTKINAAIKIMSKSPSLMGALRNADAALSSILVRGSLPATKMRH
jgi:hypothetical protein